MPTAAKRPPRPAKPIKKAAAKRKTREDHIADLEQALKDFQEAKKTRVAAADEEKRIHEEVVQPLFEQLGIDSHEVKDADGKVVVRGTFVQSQPAPVLDEVRFRKRIGVAIWNKVSTRHVDKNKLAAAIANGDVKQSVVAECSVDKPPNKPYIKIT